MAVTIDNIAYGTYTAMTVTNLQSLANDATDPYAGWQSARVDNQTSVKADDYEIFIDLSTAATAPANDSAAYVYLVPWITTDGGTTWVTGGNFGTTTLPTGTEGTASMSDPNSMKGPIPLPYKITSQRMQAAFTVGQLFSGIVPDGFSLALRNASGAALGTGCVVAYRAISDINWEFARIRVVFLSDVGNRVGDGVADVAAASDFGGAPAVAMALDGRVAVSWYDDEVSGGRTLKLVSYPCNR